MRLSRTNLFSAKKNNFFAFSKKNYAQSLSSKKYDSQAAMIRDKTKEQLLKQSPGYSLFSSAPPAFYTRKQLKNFLSPSQFNYLQQLDATCYQLILDEHLPLLKTFFFKKQQEKNPMGEFYNGLSFEEFVCRLIQARYAAAYGDGRLLHLREGYDHLFKPLEHLSNRDKLLAIGTPQDKSGIYKTHLTVEESALSHLISVNGYQIANGIGLRRQNESILPFNRYQRLLNDLNSAQVEPVLINYAVGPELRNGKSAHYDALMCLEFVNEKSGHPHFERRQLALSQAFSSIAQDLYGQEYPQGPVPREQCKVIECLLPTGGLGSERAYFYENAYKTRLKHTLKQVLLANELLIPTTGTVRLKGFGLGAFGISSLDSHIEEIYIEALNEILETLKLKKVKNIELLNFPSSMRYFNAHEGDLEYFMEHTNGVRRQVISKKHAIRIEHVLSAPLRQQEDSGYLSTSICGDSFSLPGNEGALGLPPRSSDEAAMYYVLGGLESFRQQMKLPMNMLLQKVVITNGQDKCQLNGQKIELNLSSVQPGFLNGTKILKRSSPMSYAEAIQLMNHYNQQRGVVASIQPSDACDSDMEKRQYVVQASFVNYPQQPSHSIQTPDHAEIDDQKIIKI